MKKHTTEKIYHNKFAPLYDYFQKGVKNDVKFYLGYFRSFKGRILEIGAGTGRITIPLLKHGLNVTALDISPGMLKFLKEKVEKQNLSVKTVCADMRKFKLRNRFDTVIVTFRVFQHMYSVKDQLDALGTIKRHLKPNGALIFDVYNPILKYIQKGNWQWRKDQIIKLPGVKGLVKIDFRNRYDMAEQMMYQEYRFSYPNGKKEIIPLRMRFFFRFEIEHLLARSGLKLVKLYGDFGKHPYRNNSSEMVWIVKST